MNHVASSEKFDSMGKKIYYENNLASNVDGFYSDILQPKIVSSMKVRPNKPNETEGNQPAAISPSLLQALQRGWELKDLEGTGQYEYGISEKLVEKKNISPSKNPTMQTQTSDSKGYEIPNLSPSTGRNSPFSNPMYLPQAEALSTKSAEGTRNNNYLDVGRNLKASTASSKQRKCNKYFKCIIYILVLAGIVIVILSQTLFKGRNSKDFSISKTNTTAIYQWEFSGQTQDFSCKKSLGNEIDAVNCLKICNELQGTDAICAKNIVFSSSFVEYEVNFPTLVNSANIMLIGGKFSSKINRKSHSCASFFLQMDVF